MKIISWNIRGLGSSVKKRFVSKLIKDRSPDVLLLQETKIERFERSIVQRMWGSYDVDYAESGAVGLSGGVLTIWNPEKFKPRNVTIHRRFVMVTGVLLDLECAIINVYAPNEAAGRYELWNVLTQLKCISQIPWGGRGGDFNEIKTMSERTGCTRVERSMREFKEFIN